jgi:hypothetical protein
VFDVVMTFEEKVFDSVLEGNWKILPILQLDTLFENCFILIAHYVHIDHKLL